MSDPDPAQEWAPSCFVVAHGATVRSIIRFSARHICRREAAYRARIRIYGRSLTEPVWISESETISLGAVYSVESGEIARALGNSSFLLYGEADTWSADYMPETLNTSIGVHTHYASTDATFRGHIASFAIYGAPRVVERGAAYYENFPAALLNDTHHLSIFTVNPFLRSTKMSVRLIHSGGVWESPTVTIRGKSVGEWKSAGCGFPGSVEPIGVVVKTDLKTNSFFATRDASGIMLGLDHGHPFLSQVLDHR
jgi:hypothetical protein